MKRFAILLLLWIGIICLGCGELRFAPGEAMKANAWAHFRTTQLAADAARTENASSDLRGLTELAARQSEAFVGDYGIPNTPPVVETPQQALSEAGRQLTVAAMEEATQRPDPWTAADVLLQAALAAAGVFGGVSGARIAGALQKARDANRAVREIIRGNEIFKRDNRPSAEAFKQAQQGQSPETRMIVAAVKAEKS